MELVTDPLSVQEMPWRYPFNPPNALEHDLITFSGRDHSIPEKVAMFMPSVNLQSESYPPIMAGLFLLGISIYTTTLTPLQQRRWATFRMLLSLPALLCFIEYGWGWSKAWAYEHQHNRSTYLALGTVACYGMMRVLEACWVAELDSQRPRWVLKPPPPKKGDEQSQPLRKYILPLPTTFGKRLMYTFDLLTSVRGGSWFGDRSWDFAPQFVLTYVPPSGLSKRAFQKAAVVRLIQQYLIMDVLDTFNRSITWDKTTERPVTALPWVLQILASLSVCTNTFMYMAIPYTVMSGVCVTFGSSPMAWPPLVNAPFLSTSLRDFWSNRWHHIFRRVFDRLSTAMLWPFPSTWKYRAVARRLSIFLLTTVLHLIILSTLPPRPPSPDNPSPQPYPLVGIDTIKFFLSQPLGLAIESIIITPLTELLPEGIRNQIRTAYAWGWLLWTGRYWSDVWIGKGLYDDTERPIIWSPVRGLLYVCFCLAASRLDFILHGHIIRYVTKGNFYFLILAPDDALGLCLQASDAETQPKVTIQSKHRFQPCALHSCMGTIASHQSDCAQTIATNMGTEATWHIYRLTFRVVSLLVFLLHHHPLLLHYPYPLNFPHYTPPLMYFPAAFVILFAALSAGPVLGAPIGTTDGLSLHKRLRIYQPPEGFPKADKNPPGRGATTGQQVGASSSSSSGGGGSSNDAAAANVQGNSNAAAVKVQGNTNVGHKAASSSSSSSAGAAAVNKNVPVVGAADRSAVAGKAVAGPSVKQQAGVVIDSNNRVYAGMTQEAIDAQKKAFADAMAAANRKPVPGGQVVKGNPITMNAKKPVDAVEAVSGVRGAGDAKKPVMQVAAQGADAAKPKAAIPFSAKGKEIIDGGRGGGATQAAKPKPNPFWAGMTPEERLAYQAKFKDLKKFAESNPLPVKQQGPLPGKLNIAQPAPAAGEAVVGKGAVWTRPGNAADAGKTVAGGLKKVNDIPVIAKPRPNGAGVVAAEAIGPVKVGGTLNAGHVIGAGEPVAVAAKSNPVLRPVVHNGPNPVVDVGKSFVGTGDRVAAAANVNQIPPPRPKPFVKASEDVIGAGAKGKAIPPPRPKPFVGAGERVAATVGGKPIPVPAAHNGPLSGVAAGVNPNAQGGAAVQNVAQKTKSGGIGAKGAALAALAGLAGFPIGYGVTKHFEVGPGFKDTSFNPMTPVMPN